MTISRECCRTCLESYMPFINIFEHREQDKLIADVLKECTAVEIDTSDELPSNMCTDCLEKLVAASTFKAMVIDSDLKLRQQKVAVSILTLSDLETVDIREGVMVTHETNTNYKSERNVQNKTNKVKEKIEYNIDKLGEDTNSSNKEKAKVELRSIEDKVPDSNFNAECDKNNGLSIPAISDIETVTIKEEITIKYEGVYVPIADKDNTNNNTGKLPNKIGEKKGCMEYDEDMLEDNQQNDFSKGARKKGRSDRQKLTRKEKGKQKILCKICNRSYRHDYFNIHLRHHAGNKPYKCDICNQAFVLYSRLKSHKRIHGNETPFSCNICQKRFKQLQTAQSHKQLHTQGNPYKCNNCGKGFKRPSELNRHKQTHRDETPFSCNICGKLFKHSTTLHKHKLVHTQEKPHKCNICGKGFKRLYDCTIHVRSHTQVEMCEVCGRSFPNHRRLSVHKDNHVCSYCDKHFNKSSELKIHVLIHIDKEPH